MKACVTGAAGLVGSHLADLLLEHGYEVRILDSLEPVTHPHGKPPWVPADAEFIRGAVQNRATVEHALEGCELVFHQAAFGGFAPDVASKMTASNALGTVTVMEAARQAGVGKVVVASSQAVYGFGQGECELHGRASLWRAPEALQDASWEALCPWRGCRVPLRPLRLTEDDEARAQVTPYALSKLYTEHMALMLGADWNLPVVALRYALTAGPRQSVSNPYTGICSIFATRLANGLPPVIFEDGLQTRDFTYVEDVAEANLLVAEDDRANGQVLNVGTGVGTTVMDFARMLQGVIGGPDPVCSGEFRPSDARHVVCDSTRLQALGWEPLVPVEVGVKHYAEWFLAEGRTGRVPDAVAELRGAGIVRSVHA